MNNLPNIQINQDVNTYKKLKITKLFYASSSQASISNIFTPNNINSYNLILKYILSINI